MTVVDGVEITGPMRRALRRGAHPGGAGAPRRPAPRRSTAAAASCCQAREDRYARARRRRHARLPAETEDVREDDWQVAAPAPGLVDRRVEITGPTDRKMTINALNSGAKVWLADLEDANTPLWENVVDGQLNLRDAVDRHDRLHLAGGQGLRARPTTSWPPSSSGRAAGTCRRSTSLVDGEPMSGAWSTSGSTSSTTRSS